MRPSSAKKGNNKHLTTLQCARTRMKTVTPRPLCEKSHHQLLVFKRLNRKQAHFDVPRMYRLMNIAAVAINTYFPDWSKSQLQNCVSKYQRIARSINISENYVKTKADHINGWIKLCSNQNDWRMLFFSKEMESKTVNLQNINSRYRRLAQGFNLTKLNCENSDSKSKKQSLINRYRQQMQFPTFSFEDLAIFLDKSDYSIKNAIQYAHYTLKNATLWIPRLVKQRQKRIIKITAVHSRHKKVKTYNIYLDWSNCGNNSIQNVAGLEVFFSESSHIQLVRSRKMNSIMSQFS